jgi:hypothetical protein
MNRLRRAPLSRPALAPHQRRRLRPPRVTPPPHTPPTAPLWPISLPVAAPTSAHLRSPLEHRRPLGAQHGMRPSACSRAHLVVPPTCSRASHPRVHAPTCSRPCIRAPPRVRACGEPAYHSSFMVLSSEGGGSRPHLCTFGGYDKRYFF